MSKQNALFFFARFLSDDVFVEIPPEFPISSAHDPKPVGPDIVDARVIIPKTDAGFSRRSLVAITRAVLSNIHSAEFLCRDLLPPSSSLAHAEFRGAGESTLQRGKRVEIGGPPKPPAGMSSIFGIPRENGPPLPGHIEAHFRAPAMRFVCRQPSRASRRQKRRTTGDAFKLHDALQSACEGFATVNSACSRRFVSTLLDRWPLFPPGFRRHVSFIGKPGRFVRRVARFLARRLSRPNSTEQSFGRRRAVGLPRLNFSAVQPHWLPRLRIARDQVAGFLPSAGWHASVLTSRARGAGSSSKRVGIVQQ